MIEKAQNSQFKSMLFRLRCQLAKPDWWRRYQDALSHEKMLPDELAAFNWKQRMEALAFAYQSSPYYHELYKAAGLEPGDVKTEEDWQRVPMLTREALRFNFDTIRVPNVSSSLYTLYTTGGSTGEPSKVLKDNRFSEKGMIWRAASWAGLSLGQNSAVIMRTHPSNWKTRLRAFAAWFPANNIMLDAGNMTEDTIRKFVIQWQNYRPVSVNGYVGGIHQIALYCLDNHIELPIPIAVSTTAAPLGEVQKNDIRKAFHAPVYDSYVATEAHPIANQCSCLAESGNRALHIHSDYRHVEFVDEQGRCKPIGEEGDILVTDCGDRVFPIIRYRLGDRGHALPGRCACGRPYPLMDAVRGRSFDFIYLEKGRIAGECWATAFDNCLNAVHNFQIHQYADKSITLLVVLNKEYPEAEKCVRQVAAELQQQLGTIPLTLKLVDELAHNRGKIKYIISDIKE